MAIKLFNNPLIERALDASWARNEAISDNIANVDTPGYKRKDVNFEEYLTAAMQKDSIAGIVANSKHIPTGNDINTKLRTTTDYSSTSMRLDGNNVDIDAEMTELAKNQILYNTYATIMNKDFAMLKSAIKEGR